MGLQKYIRQLLEDIDNATNNVPEPYQHWEEADEDFGVLPWMEDPDNAPRKSLEEWTTLKKEQFPPAHRLSDGQISQLLPAIKAMLDAYNCSAVFQIEVPERIQYRVIRERFQQEVPMLKANYYFFELCDRHAQRDRSQCLLGEAYCHCAFFESFFDDFKGEAQDCEPEENSSTLDPYEEYMLKRRYGENWRKYIPTDEEEINLEDFLDEDDVDDDTSDDCPF